MMYTFVCFTNRGIGNLYVTTVRTLEHTQIYTRSVGAGKSIIQILDSFVKSADPPFQLKDHRHLEAAPPILYIFLPNNSYYDATRTLLPVELHECQNGSAKLRA